MSGVISPTNLSLYSSSITSVPRSSSRGPRWNTMNSSFMMEDDFHMITHPVANNTENQSVLLMDEGLYFIYVFFSLT